MKVSEFDVVLYHKNCSDGIAAAFPFWRENKSRSEISFCIATDTNTKKIEKNITESESLQHTEEETKTLPFFAQSVSYEEEPPYSLIKDRNVAIVDFCYKRNAIEKICDLAKFVVILDHHASAKEELKNLDIDNLFVIFDMTQSGAQIAWRYCYPKTPIPWFIDFIADRDLWAWKLENSKEITIGLKKNGYIRWEKMEELLPLEGEKLKECKEEMYRVGQKFSISREKTIEIYCQRAMVCNFFEFTVGCVECANYDVVSEVGHYLSNMEHVDFGVTWCYQFERDIWRISFRSSERSALPQDISSFVDVSKIAARFGGGGHPKAAGITIYGKNAHIPKENDKCLIGTMREYFRPKEFEQFEKKI